MLLRNREVRLQLGLSCAVVALCCILAWLVSHDVEVLLLMLACGALLALVSLGFTAWRYRRLRQLATRVDLVLAGRRDVSLDDMHEGELSILASQLSKTLSRLQVANDELEAEKLALSDALADISHQLRTPLTSLGLELELMRRNEDALTRQTRVRNAERLLSRVQWLVSSLLKLARLDAGVVRLESRKVDVESLVRASFEPLAISFDLADVAFEPHVARGASFEGDPSWSGEALTNVLKNCLEHTPAGGVVHLDAWEDAVACRMRVRDSGPGIAEADLPHVFERFYRGADEGQLPSAANPAGVGIGLSLARALVVAQGGSLTASNATDAADEATGACFDLVFYKLVV